MEIKNPADCMLNETGEAIERLIIEALYDVALMMEEGDAPGMGVEIIRPEFDITDIEAIRAHILIKDPFVLAAYLAEIGQERFKLVEKVES